MTAPLRVTVLTTSYPRWKGDAAGRFVGDAVGWLRERGVEVEVVSPREFRHFGIAYGAGVVGNLRRAPWKALLLPAMLASFALAARRASRDADVVHAHWLPTGAIGLLTGKPVVLQLWGTDVELARRVPRLARALMRRAALVVCASTSLARSARGLGASRVEVIPGGVRIPDEIGEEDEPPFVLYAGRLSPEKGVLELLEAARELQVVVIGDGPLRERIPAAEGFLPHDELQGWLARSAVVACPSFREGFGVVCAEAMAHGRAVVASAVGGFLDLVEDGETGLLVPAGDVASLRGALERLLGDADLRRRMGLAGRQRAVERLSWPAVADATIAAYDRVLAERGAREGRTHAREARQRAR